MRRQKNPRPVSFLPARQGCGADAINERRFRVREGRGLRSPFQTYEAAVGSVAAVDVVRFALECWNADRPDVLRVNGDRIAEGEQAVRLFLQFTGVASLTAFERATARSYVARTTPAERRAIEGMMAADDALLRYAQG